MSHTGSVLSPYDFEHSELGSSVVSTAMHT